MRMVRKMRKKPFVMAEILSAFIYTFCAYTSPLYVFSGSAFFFSVAKAMLRGSILYKDILEQKGLLIYILYMPAYLISHTNYIGVWMIELLLVLINTFLVYKIAKELKLSEIGSFAAAVIFSTIVYTHMAGYVVEFDVLPCFLLSIYLLVKQKVEMGSRDVFINGLMAGIVLWSKFSLLGFYFIYAAVLCLRLAWRKRIGDAIKCGLRFLAGMATVSVPCLLYFGMGGALKELARYYFVNNISGYGYNDMSTIKNIVINYLIDVPVWEMRWSPVLFIALLFSIAGVFAVKMEAWKKVLLIVGGALHYIVVFLHGAMFQYYLFAFAAYAVFGSMLLVKAGGALMNFAKCSAKIRRFTAGTAAVSFVLAAILALLPEKVSAVLNYRNSPQYVFGQYMNRGGTTSLDYGILDQGFFTASGITPSTWAYCRLNWDNPQMLQDQLDSVTEGRTAYVVTTTEVDLPDALTENYRFVMRCEGEGKVFLLYEKREE